MKSPSPQTPVSKDEVPASGALGKSLIEELRSGYRMDSADLARHHAVLNNPLKSLALNRGRTRSDDGYFTHRVHSVGIANQGSSGRCWIFAGLNVIRPQVARRHGIAGLEFSQAYLQFWDKIEKANLYLESIIELRDADYLDRDWEVVNRISLEDGGWWNYLADLMTKYGVVPRQAMPETHASSNTATLNELLERLLKARAVRILDLHRSGSGTEQLRKAKAGVLAEVYRLMVIHFGEPPTEFEWRYERDPGQPSETDVRRNPDSAENPRLSQVERHTPASFYEQYVGQDLDEFVCLYNDPLNRLGCHYRFDRARNMAGGACMSFVNIGTEEMKEIAKASILANEPLWFAVNMKLDQSEELGVMKDRLFDYESFLGIDLSLSKADRTRFHAGASGHAMALVGVDLDQEGRPRKWLVENSWGDAKGNKGLWTMYDDWFDEHVYTLIVHRRLVSDATLALFEQEAIVLPAWYPGTRGRDCRAD